MEVAEAFLSIQGDWKTVAPLGGAGMGSCGRAAWESNAGPIRRAKFSAEIRNQQLPRRTASCTTDRAALTAQSPPMALKGRKKINPIQKEISADSAGSVEAPPSIPPNPQASETSRAVRIVESVE